ncbi:MAG: ferrochelatase [Promicromonosporaceae bacterium]|nr:ferrochelatase [Promicromonosporaceae bacterium]
MTFDALVILGFGGPEGPDDVWPFLERVAAGRRIPRERLAGVAEHYLSFGGVSPVNAQTRALRDALAGRLRERGLGLPVVVANRNSAPLVPDVLAGLAAGGASRALVLATTPFASYSSCRQYREDLAAGAVAGLEPVKVPPFPDLPGLERAFVENVAAQLRGPGGATRVLFCTHSIPLSMDASAGPHGGAYQAQQRDLAARVIAGAAAAAGCQVPAWDLVYQSRSGPPQVPWLEPDVSVALAEAAAQGFGRVIVVPIGFLTDHMEVVWDLDTEAAASAAALGLDYVRVATPGASPAFLDSLTDLLSRWLTEPLRPAEAGEPCAGGCCLGSGEPGTDAPPVVEPTLLASTPTVDAPTAFSAAAAGSSPPALLSAPTATAASNPPTGGMPPADRTELKP